MKTKTVRTAARITSKGATRKEPVPEDNQYEIKPIRIGAITETDLKAIPPVKKKVDDQTRRLIQFLLVIRGVPRENPRNPRISQQELGGMLRIASTSIQQYEQGQHHPDRISAGNLKALAAANGWSEEEFRTWLRTGTVDVQISLEQVISYCRWLSNLYDSARILEVLMPRHLQLLDSMKHTDPHTQGSDSEETDFPEFNSYLIEQLNSRKNDLEASLENLYPEQDLDTAWGSWLQTQLANYGVSQNDFNAVYEGGYISDGMLLPLSKILRIAADDLRERRDRI